VENLVTCLRTAWRKRKSRILERNIMVDCNVSDTSQIEDIIHLDDIHMRSSGSKQQLLVPTGLEELKTGRTASTKALLDSGCVRTCIDKHYAREQKWPLQRIL
jgi:hypothetical protein